MAVKGKSHYTIRKPMYPDSEVICTQELYDPEYGCQYMFGFLTFVYLKGGHVIGTEILSGLNKKVDSEYVEKRFLEWISRAKVDGKI